MATSRQLAGGAEGQVTAQRSGRRDNPEGVRLEVVEHAGGVDDLRGLPEQGCGPAKRMPPRHAMDG